MGEDFLSHATAQRRNVKSESESTKANPKLELAILAPSSLDARCIQSIHILRVYASMGIAPYQLT